MRTTDLCDANEATTRVLAPGFRDFGRRASFHGRIRTLRVFEDNALVRAELETPGGGDVLVIDGGGSVRTALVGGNLGKLAETNGWAGIVVNGAVRDSDELAQCDVGIKALAAIPRKSTKTGAGERGLPIVVTDVTITAGQWLYADADGIVIAEHELR